MPEQQPKHKKDTVKQLTSGLSTQLDRNPDSHYQVGMGIKSYLKKNPHSKTLKPGQLKSGVIKLNFKILKFEKLFV